LALEAFSGGRGLAGEGRRGDMLILGGRGRHWVSVWVTRVPRQRSANATRDAAGACPSYVPKPYSDPTLTIYLIFCMRDITNLKNYFVEGRSGNKMRYTENRASAPLRYARRGRMKNS